jgi:hypothetical protein
VLLRKAEGRESERNMARLGSRLGLARDQVSNVGDSAPLDPVGYVEGDRARHMARDLVLLGPSKKERGDASKAVLTLLDQADGRGAVELALALALLEPLKEKRGEARTALRILMTFVPGCSHRLECF